MQFFKIAEWAKEIVSVGHIQLVCDVRWKNSSEDPWNKDQRMRTRGWGGSESPGTAQCLQSLWETQSLSI